MWLKMTFISNLNKLEQQHLKSVLVKEIENNKLHGCRVMGFDFSKQQDNKIGFPKGWMKEDFSLVKDLKELNKYNIITRPTNLLVIEFDKKEAI